MIQPIFFVKIWQKKAIDHRWPFSCVTCSAQCLWWSRPRLCFFSLWNPHVSVQLRSRVRGGSVRGRVSGVSGGGGGVRSRSDGKSRLCISVTLSASRSQAPNPHLSFTGHALQRRIQPVLAILTPLIHFQMFGLSDTSPTAADLGGKNLTTLLDEKKKKKRNFRICYKLWIRNATLNQYIKEGGFFFFSFVFCFFKETWQHRTLNCNRSLTETALTEKRKSFLPLARLSAHMHAVPALDCL